MLQCNKLQKKAKLCSVHKNEYFCFARPKLLLRLIRYFCTQAYLIDFLVTLELKKEEIQLKGYKLADQILLDQSSGEAILLQQTPVTAILVAVIFVVAIFTELL